MGLNKVGIGPNTAAHRDKLSKSHREEQGLSSREAQSTSQGTLYCEVFMVEKERRRVREKGRWMDFSLLMQYSMALYKIQQTYDTHPIDVIQK